MAQCRNPHEHLQMGSWQKPTQLQIVAVEADGFWLRRRSSDNDLFIASGLGAIMTAISLRVSLTLRNPCSTFGRAEKTTPGLPGDWGCQAATAACGRGSLAG